MNRPVCRRNHDDSRMNEMPPLFRLFILVGLVGCASQTANVRFDDVLNGNISTSSDFAVIGLMDTTGVNFYSLFREHDQQSSSNCIPLILDHPGQIRAKQLHGARVLVRGHAIPMDELNDVLPYKYGEINGREWSGTRCDGRIGIYVTNLQRQYE